MIPFATGFPGIAPPRLAPPAPSSSFACDADRVLPAGGALVSRLLPEAATPFQRIYRMYPEVGIYTATRQKPYTMVLGTFVVPAEMSLLLCEYQFLPYRFDGVLAGQPVPLEDRRLSLSVGYDLRIASVGRRGNISAQILPGNPNPAVNPEYPQMQTGGTVFPPLPTSQPPLGTVTVSTIYGIEELNSGGGQQVASGLQPPPQQPGQYVPTLFGASMLPQNQESHQGPSGMPFTYYVNEKDNVTIAVGVFSPVQIPLAFFEGHISGYLLPLSSMKAMLEKVRPCT